jgi:hypothetical protein
MVDLFNADDLTDLALGRGGPRISLFLPTHRGGPSTVRHGIRLRNLLRRVEDALRAEGMRDAQIGALLEPVGTLIETMMRQDQPSKGVALFIGPDDFRRLRVPLRLPELVTIGDRFVVRPLLPLLCAGGHFYVLRLTRDELRLCEGTALDLDEVALEGTPLAVWQTMPRQLPLVHAVLPSRDGFRDDATFHGGPDDPTVPVVQHFQRVDQALREVLRCGQVPLVLAGARSLQALYRKANTYPMLMSDGVDGNPHYLRAVVLHRRAWAIVDPILRRAEDAAVSAHRAAQHTGGTCTHPMEVLAAAEQGRVETLFLSTSTPDWCASSEAGGLIRLGDPSHESEQVDLAALATLRTGGRVFAVPSQRMPECNPVAATLLE